MSIFKRLADRTVVKRCEKLARELEKLKAEHAKLETRLDIVSTERDHLAIMLTVHQERWKAELAAEQWRRSQLTGEVPDGERTGGGDTEG